MFIDVVNNLGNSGKQPSVLKGAVWRRRRRGGDGDVLQACGRCAAGPERVGRGGGVDVLQRGAPWAAAAQPDPPMKIYFYGHRQP